MANAKHIGLLQQGVNTWNLWRTQNPHIIPDLSGATIYGVNLISKTRHGEIMRIDFSKANLSNTNFCGVSLHTAKFSKANLTGANLSGIGAKFDSEQLAHDNKFMFNQANLTGANLSGALLSFSDFNKANLTGVNLTGANLYKTHFQRANLREANLREADLSGAEFSFAILREACLQMANLTGTYFCFADLRAANLYGAKGNLDKDFIWRSVTDFYGANLSGANLSKTELGTTDFREANLSQTIPADINSDRNESFNNNQLSSSQKIIRIIKTTNTSSFE